MLFDPKWEAKAASTYRVLLRAAEIIETRGLKQFSFGGDEGPICGLRAIELARLELLGQDGWGPERTALLDFIGEESVVNWVDSPLRTQAEVVSALRGAAAHS